MQITWQTTDEPATLTAMPARSPQVADRLLALREELGLSQEEAVARTNGAITLRQWQRWEKGESEPYKRNLAVLSEVFEIPMGEFFGEATLDARQLDRIEMMLKQVLSRLPTRDDAEEYEQELDEALPPEKMPSPKAATSGRSARRRAGAG